MLDIFTKILEQFGAFFRLQAQLSSLSNNNPILAGMVIFVLIVIVANIAITQFIEFRNKFFGQWVHSRLAWTSLVVGFCAAALVSTSIVLNLRQAVAPVPTLVVESDTVMGRPLLLSWKYDDTQKKALRFQVQSSKDAAFSDDVKDVGYRSGRSMLVGSVNDKRYWRVRAVDEGFRGISNWSRAIQITQYENSLKRIRETHSVNVYISNSFNQGFFLFEANDGKGTLTGYDVAVIDYVINRLPAYLGIDGPINYNPVPVDWEELLVAPKNGRADIIISTITSLSQREDSLSIKFSKPYYCTTQSLIFRPIQLSKPTVQMIENKRVGVQRKTTSEDLIEKFRNDGSGSGKFKVVLYDEADLMIENIVKGEIHFGLTDTPFARAAELQYGTAALNFRELVKDEDFPKGIDPEQREEKYAIAVRAGEAKLIEAINRIIDEMREEKLGKLLQQAAEEFYKVSQSAHTPPIDRRKDPSECRSD
jgi:ABC-type amino acid transport substrate-binding protein